MQGVVEEKRPPVLWIGIGLLIFIVAMCVLGVFLLGSAPSSQSSPGLPPSVPVTTVHSTQRQIPLVPPPAVTPRIPTPQQPTIQPTPRPVDFSLDPGIQTSCGTTCRDTTAAITNTGDKTAHNVCVQLTVYNSDGKLIKLNGGSNIQACIGDLAGGQSKSQAIHIEVDCGFLFSDCIGEKLTLKCQATSNEKTVQFPDQTIST
jgi:hypothetical protein